MKKIVFVVAVGCLLVGLGTAVAVPPGPGGGGVGPGPCQLEGVTRTVTNTENGVLIQVSSDDPAVVKLIQAHLANPPDGPAGPPFEGVQHTVTNKDNGVVIDITSENAEVVQRIQAHFAEQADKAAGQGRGFKRHRGQGAPKPIEGAERKVTNTEKGVLIEISSDDPAVVEQIQARFAERDAKGRGPGLQDQGGRRGPGKGKGRHGGFRGFKGRRGPGGFGLMQPIEGTERSVTNLDNGVRIEITSEDPQVVQTIQERFAEFPPKCPRGPQQPAATPEESVPSPEPQTQE
jgi:TusA-related sulfurtransferase